MNTTFTLARFGHTLKADLMSNYRTYLMWIGASLGVIAVMIGLISWGMYDDVGYDYDIEYHQDRMWSTETAIFVFGFLFISAVCASILMSQMADKRDAIAWLTLPSSQLEKFVSRSLICLIIFPVATIVGMGIIDLLRCMIASVMFPGRYIAPLFEFYEENEAVTMSVGYFFGLQSLFALGSTIWPKRSAIKTALALTVIAIVYTWILVTTAECVYESGYHYAMFSKSAEDFISDHIKWLVFACCCIFAAINYVVAYYRFKESEIIKRW